MRPSLLGENYLEFFLKEENLNRDLSKLKRGIPGRGQQEQRQVLW